MDKKYALALTAIVAGCSAAGVDDTQVAPTTAATQAPNPPDIADMAAENTSAADATLARLPDAAEGDGAVINGTLRIQNGCAVIEAADEIYLLAVSDPAISWDSGTLILPDGSRLAPGASISAGGSQLTAPASAQWKLRPPAECSAMKVWASHSVVTG